MPISDEITVTTAYNQRENHMNLSEAILTRVTTPPLKMKAPGPNRDQIDTLIAAAAAAPDHGKLCPWRFLIVDGEAREQLGDLFAEAVRLEVDGTSASEIDKQRQAPLRAPVLIIAIACLQTDHAKIPELEQWASAAAAVQNMLLMAHAMGFVSKWATGRNADSTYINQGLGMNADERIMGIIYLGSPGAQQELPERPDTKMIAKSWPS